MASEKPMAPAHVQNLRFCGVTLGVCADELGIPCVCGAVVRFQWILYATVFLFLTQGRFGLTGCDEENDQDLDLNLFILITLVLMFISFLTYLALYKFSSRGNVFEPEKRKNFTFLSYILIVLYLVELVLTIYGSSIASAWVIESENEVCENRSFQKYSLLWFWLAMLYIDFLLFFGLASLLVSRPSRKQKRIQGLDLTDQEIATVHWKACCKSWLSWIGCLTCGLFGNLGGEEEEHALETTAEVFTQWFQGHDIQRASDILVALILLRAEQRKRRKDMLVQMWDEDNFRESIRDSKRKFSFEANNLLWGTPEKPKADNSSRLPKSGKFPAFEMKASARLARTDTDSMHHLNDCVDFSPYMLGIFGWPLKAYMHLKKGQPISLGKTLLTCHQSSMHGDNIFACHSDALVRQAKVTPDQIVYASFASYEAKVVPHAIVVDHELRAVIVTCRGTMSVADALTDAMVHTEPLIRAGRQWGFDGEGYYCHRGFLACAETIRNQFQTHKILHKLLGAEAKAKPSMNFEEGEVTLAQSITDLPNCTGYRLVVVGQSLGASIAAVLSLLLRPEFPQLKCIAYSCPGCVFDTELAESANDWCVVPFVGKDIVPRMSWHTLVRLRAQFLEMLRRSKANKNTIIKSLAVSTPLEKLLYAENEVPDTPERNRLRDQIEELAHSHEKETAQRFEKVQMWPPGRLLHFARTAKTKKPGKICCGSNKPEFTATWIKNREEMHEVSVSARMLLDHMPDYDAEVYRKVYHEMKAKGQRLLDV